MTHRCPKCGAEPTNANPFVKRFCTTCYFEEHPVIVLRRAPEAKICPRCQAYYCNGRWTLPGQKSEADHLSNMVSDLLHPLFTPSQPASFEIHLHEVPPSPPSKAKEIQVDVLARTDDYPHEEQKRLTIPIIPTLCSQCKQSAGGYFEATLQIRASSGKLQSAHETQIIAYLTQRRTEADLPEAALKFINTRGGFDVKCISGRWCRSLAKALAEQFGLILGVSSKVTGRSRDGKTLRRESYSLRFPPFQVHDVIAYQDHLFMITGLRNGRYLLANLETEHRQTLSPKELAEIDAELLNAQIQIYQVISVDDEMYQLMHQTEYTIYDLPRPEQDLQVGSQVAAIQWKDHLVLLPHQ